MMKLPPFDHQLKEWEQSRADKTRAIFWEPGTGKSKLTLDTAVWMYVEGDINCLFVIAPNGVHENWTLNEIPKHVLEKFSHRSFTWFSKKAANKGFKLEAERALKYEGLLIVSMSYDAFMTKAGKAFADKLVKARELLMVCDESTRIKSPGAKRTRSICTFGKKVKYKRILTGTPAHNSAFDVYSQIKFLDWDYWKDRGWSTYAAFQGYFGVFESIDVGSRKIPIFKYHKNLEELKAAVDEISSRVVKDEVLDLPPKLYSRRICQMSDEQSRIYKEIRDEFITFLGTEMVSTPLIVTRMLRLQQVLCGYLTTDDGELIRFKQNPRMDSLVEWMEDLPYQAIIWCRFREDINWVLERMGDRCYRYDGQVSDNDRRKAVQGFQNQERQFFVANAAAAGTGLTLHAAKAVMYYSNHWSPEMREQSEDRAHRIGQDGAILGGSHGVHYVDMAVPGTIDMKIITSLRNKFDVARRITGDIAREWL